MRFFTVPLLSRNVQVHAVNACPDIAEMRDSEASFTVGCAFVILKWAKTQELEDFLASISVGGTGSGPRGLTATPPSKTAPSFAAGGQPRPGASWTPA